jgi:CRP-like cAMP-binding protein
MTTWKDPRHMDVEQLQTASVFSSLPPECRAALAAAMTERHVEQGSELVTADDFGYHVFLILDGRAEVSADGAVLRELGPGEVCGEIGVLITGRRTAAVRALTPMRVATLFAQDLHHLQHDHPELDRALRAIAADHLGPPS